MKGNESYIQNLYSESGPLTEFILTLTGVTASM